MESLLENNTIFDKQSFTLKEFCKTFIINNNKNNFGEKILDDSLSSIIYCYLYFSSGNLNYKKYLQELRFNKGFFLDNNISFREILMIFDLEFTKLVIRIKTEHKDYDISVTWDEFHNKIKNVTKNDLYKFYKKLVEKIKN
jgi:hypothetical protein